jgi:hypothetical protein
MKNTRKHKIKYRGGSQDQCIYVDLGTDEGLGNQLFMYANALVEHSKKHLPLCVVKSKSNPHTKRNYRNILNGKKLNATNKTNKNTIVISQNYRVYQNYNKIKDIIPKLKSILLKNEFNKDSYKEYRNLINSPTTAFMHVRRGDKLNRSQDLQPSYFTKGLIELSKNNNIKTIYIFSDDIEWCKNNDSLWKSTVTDKNIKYFDNKDELIVLYVMLLCEAGALLSNSTFGMWGAMLGADMNPNSIIVYNSKPKDFPGQTNPIQFPERWIGI